MARHLELRRRERGCRYTDTVDKAAQNRNGDVQVCRSIIWRSPAERQSQSLLDSSIVYRGDEVDTFVFVYNRESWRSTASPPSVRRSQCYIKGADGSRHTTNSR